MINAHIYFRDIFHGCIASKNYLSIIRLGNIDLKEIICLFEGENSEDTKKGGLWNRKKPDLGCLAVLSSSTHSRGESRDATIIEDNVLGASAEISVQDGFCAEPMCLDHRSALPGDGMRREGPQILTIGDGDHEYDMIKVLMDEGYQGPWGILGHIETEDVQKVLERNVKGLRTLQTKQQ